MRSRKVPSNRHGLVVNPRLTQASGNAEPRAALVRRNRKTVYGWIATGKIGEADGLFVVQGSFLTHWPTFRAKQFKPREKLPARFPIFRRKLKMAWLETDRHGRLRIAFKYYDGRTYRQMDHRNLAMLIYHYWRWINPDELSRAS
jgi:hypothetical protein